MVENNSEKSLDALINNCPKDNIIGDNLVIAWSKINSSSYKKILCTVSGGADSDIVVDICSKCDKDNKINYVWFNTGLEYTATKAHLNDLREKYGIEILEYKTQKPIPTVCKQYGQPFLNKRVSDYIGRLQKHNFQWEDKPFEDLLYKYCKWSENREKWIGCYTALKWWCNEHDCNIYNISHNKWLKEFIIQNNPKFKISSLCCKYSKKDVLKNLLKNTEYDLNIFGVRKAEGGTRASAYKNCFSSNVGACDEYRPVFFYLNDTKKIYNCHYGISNSKCYSEYGLKRTGCAGCPFGRDFEYELDVIQKYEPKLFAAVNNIFGDSYEYTRKYREFCEKMNREIRNRND